MTLILNKVFQYTPYDIIINIIDFNDEDKYYNKAGHKEKMNDVFIDIKNMASIFGVDINASLFQKEPNYELGEKKVMYKVIQTYTI